MHNLTPWEIFAAIVGGVLALAAAINTIGSAVEKIVKARAAAKAPSVAQDDRLEKLEVSQDKMMGFLDSDKHRLDSLEKGNRVTQKSLLALLAHAIDGNNVHQLEEAEKELEDYLINR